MLVEAVPPEVAAFIAAELPIPVLGIGAGAAFDGQCLIVSPTCSAPSRRSRPSS